MLREKTCTILRKKVFFFSSDDKVAQENYYQFIIFLPSPNPHAADEYYAKISFTLNLKRESFNQFFLFH